MITRDLYEILEVLKTSLQNFDLSEVLQQIVLGDGITVDILWELNSQMLVNAEEMTEKDKEELEKMSQELTQIIENFKKKGRASFRLRLKRMNDIIIMCEEEGFSREEAFQIALKNYDEIEVGLSLIDLD